MTTDVATIKEIAAKIAAIRKEAEEIKEMSGGIQAVDRNVDRILSSVKMLEINVSDIADLL